jgi:hypothetical protein
VSTTSRTRERTEALLLEAPGARSHRHWWPSVMGCAAALGEGDEVHTGLPAVSSKGPGRSEGPQGLNLAWPEAGAQGQDGVRTPSRSVP